MKPRSERGPASACRRRALPLSHPDQPLTSTFGARAGTHAAVVGNLDLQLRSRAAQTGADPRARCVPEHIRECLLEDSEGRQRPPRGEVIQLAIDMQVHLEARAAHLSDEVFNTLKRQRRARSDPLAVGPEESKQPMHLLHRVAADALHGQQRLSLACLLRGKQPAYRACLDSHHADAVADHVVELPRDAGSLLGHSDLGLLVPLALQLRGSRLQPIRLEAHHAYGAAHGQRHEHRSCVPEEIGHFPTGSPHARHRVGSKGGPRPRQDAANGSMRAQ